MSAKKKAGKKVAKRAKPAKAPKGRAAKASAPKRAAAKKPVAKKSGAKAISKKLSAKKGAAKRKAAPKKPVAKKLAAKKPVAAAKTVSAKKPAIAKSNGKAPAIKRRDATGHLDPAYAADLRARSEEDHGPKDDDRAFKSDALSDELGEEFVETVTSGEDEGTEIRDQDVTEELGGPFTVTSGNTEFASEVDESNPVDATREPFPRT